MQVAIEPTAISTNTTEKVIINPLDKLNILSKLLSKSLIPSIMECQLINSWPFLNRDRVSV